VEPGALKRIAIAAAAAVALVIVAVLWRGEGLSPPERIAVLVPDGVRIKVEVLNASGQRGLARPILTIRHQSPPTARGDDLVPVEGKDGHDPKAPSFLPPVGRSQGLGGILYQGDLEVRPRPGRPYDLAEPLHHAELLWGDDVEAPEGDEDDGQYAYDDADRRHLLP